MPALPPSWFHHGQERARSAMQKKPLTPFGKRRAVITKTASTLWRWPTHWSPSGHTREASQALLQLRESTPENAEINLSLARLEAKGGETAEAVRYYHNALYGRWTGSQVDEDRRKVGVELVRLLLDHQDRSGALSELLSPRH